MNRRRFFKTVAAAVAGAGLGAFAKGEEKVRKCATGGRIKSPWSSKHKKIPMHEWYKAKFKVSDEEFKLMYEDLCKRTSIT